MSVDMSKTIAAKSDTQINADDLFGGPETYTITKVYSTGKPEQPVAISVLENPLPYLPSKSMRRCLVDCFGVNGDDYVGRKITLFRNPDIKFGGILCGGIEIAAVSHIDKPRAISVTVSRGKKKQVIIDVLRDKPPAPKPNAAEIDNLRQKMALESEVHALGETMKAVNDSAGMDACRATFAKLSSKLTAEQRAALVALAEAAKGRVAVPVAPADVTAASKGQLL